MTTTDEQGLKAALDRLAARDADIAARLAALGYPPPRTRPASFATLVHIILAQQVSVRSAAAAMEKLMWAAGGKLLPSVAVTLGEGGLRACGFSRPKASYTLHLAEAIMSGRFDPAGLNDLDDDEAIRAITRLRGFGRWSAEIYLLTALGRMDVFPAGDLALRIAYQQVRGLDAPPAEAELREMVASWAPERGAGALLLWHHYGSATLGVR